MVRGNDTVLHCFAVRCGKFKEPKIQRGLGSATFHPRLFTGRRDAAVHAATLALVGRQFRRGWQRQQCCLASGLLGDGRGCPHRSLTDYRRPRLGVVPGRCPKGTTFGEWTGDRRSIACGLVGRRRQETQNGAVLADRAVCFANRSRTECLCKAAVGDRDLGDLKRCLLRENRDRPLLCSGALAAMG